MRDRTNQPNTKPMTEYLFDPTKYESSRVGFPDWAHDIVGPDDGTESPLPPGPDSVTGIKPIINAVTESPLPPGPYSVPEDNHSVHRCVAQYSPRGTAGGGNLYFRFIYRDDIGHKHHVHIPGGNVRHPDARDHARQVEAAAAAGKSTAEILALIGSWNRCDRKKPPF